MKKLILLFIFCLGLALPCFAADGTSFDPTKISVQSVGASIPVGTVITWPSNSWPSDKDNWLECNGQSISSAVYPELVGVVGSRVPDYRGTYSCAASSPGIASDRPRPTLSRATVTHTQPTAHGTASAGSSNQDDLGNLCRRRLVWTREPRGIKWRVSWPAGESQEYKQAMGCRTRYASRALRSRV
ncbi:phage tail protein [Bilophila wadsworthia]|uniref:phage tail protein n=1 Tax=Bilophila wadsworthia TaxID=35833 RepID=UPI00351FE3B5